jgi:hypothetical protein
MKTSSAFTDWTGAQVRTFSVIFDDEFDDDDDDER